MSRKSLTSRTVVDEDDLCEIIYHMLWNKNVFYPSSGLPVFVPDTVMFRSGTPIGWYFSDSEGILKRKKEPKLTIPHVLETFIKKKSKYGIVAYYIHLPETQGYNYSEDEDESKQKTIIEYYDEPAFIKLMSNPNQKLKRGILQRFIDPQGERNSLIQCVWTKRISMFNRRTNSRLLKDHTANIYEKCVTFEGPAYMSESTAMKGNALGAKVKECLDFIINHISNATFERYQVSKLVCYFKVDEQSRIWYLFSGFFRVNKKVLDIALKGRKSEYAEQIDLNDNFTIPSNIAVGAKMVGAYRKPEETLEACPRCSNIFSSSNFVEITYKAIMDAAEKPSDIKPKEDELENAPNIGMILAPEQTVNKEDEQGFHVRNKQDDIPYIIRKMHQRLRSHEFEKIKNEDYFKIKKTRVCYSCYFYLSKTNLMAGNDQNPNSIQAQMRNPRPVGQTLSMNEKLKTINESKSRGNSVSSFRISPNKRVSGARANSVGSFDQRGQLVSLKKDMNQTSRGLGSTFENNIVAKSRERAKETWKDEAIRFELQRLHSREEFTQKLAAGEASEVLPHTAPVDLLSQPNIFENREMGKIVKLETIPQRTRSMANVSMPETTPLSRSSSYSKKSNNYMDALYTVIQGSPRTGNRDYHKVSFIPEQTERLDSDEENISRQLVMADPINLSNYRKPAKLSKLPIRENVEQQRTFSQGSQSDRIPRTTTQGLLYQAYLSKQITAAEHTQENSRNRSSQKSSSNITFREKEKDLSLQRDPSKTKQFTQNVKGTIKLYMGKVQTEQLPATKRGFDLQFINDKREGIIRLNRSGAAKENIQKKKIHKKHVSEIFRPLGRPSNNVALRASPSKESQATNYNVYPAAEPLKNVEIKTVEARAAEIKSAEIKSTEIKSANFGAISDRTTPRLQQVTEEVPATTINEMIGETEPPIASPNDQYSELRKISEPTLLSQFPTQTNHSLPPFKSNETPHRLRKPTTTKEDEREGLTTELEYSLTQPLKSSMMRKDTFSQKGEMDNESRKSRSISPPLEDKGDVKNREPYLKRVPDEQFNELTAKPFSSRRSIKKNDSNLMMSRNSGLYESQRTNQEENRVLPPHLLTEGDDGEVVSAFSGAEDRKSGSSNNYGKSEITSHVSSQQTPLSEEYKDSNKSLSGKEEKYSEKFAASKSLSQLVGSIEIKSKQGNKGSETIKIEDERKPSI